MCSCQSAAKGSCRQTSLSVFSMTLILLLGCLQVLAHIWLCLRPNVTLRMTLKISSGPRGSLPNPLTGPALSQMFPGPLGDLACPSWDITQSSLNCKATGSQPEHSRNIHASVLPFPCAIPQALMEILIEMKAEFSVCCFNQILNLTPSDKTSNVKLM